MIFVSQRRVGLVIVGVLAVSPLVWSRAQSQTGDSPKPNAFFVGKVIPLAEVLAKTDAKLDVDASPAWLVLHTDDGKVYPLLKDSGSRMFFSDAKLLRRPMRLTGKFVSNSQILQVINVHSLVKNKLHDVYYWCDICTIKRFEGGLCDCCGMNLDFREEPAK